MLKVTASSGKEYGIELDGKDAFQGTINGSPFTLDVATPQPNTFHILRNNKSYNCRILSVDHKTKSFVIEVNKNRYTMVVQDQYAALLEKLGMNKFQSQQVLEVKAPMPGMVLDIMVEKHAIVLAGAPLIVLEAMKMENVLKSPVAGTIKAISVKKGTAVEKNQLLISFEQQ